MGSRGNLYHLLVPPLDGAVSLIQVQDVPILVPWAYKKLDSAFPRIQVTPIYPLAPWALWLLGHLTSALSQVPWKVCPKGCYCKPGRSRLLLFHTTHHSPRICTSMCLGFSMNFSTNNAPFPKAAKASE